MPSARVYLSESLRLVQLWFFFLRSAHFHPERSRCAVSSKVLWLEKSNIVYIAVRKIQNALFILYAATFSGSHKCVVSSVSVNEELT